MDILEKYSGKVKGILSTFDRMIIKGHLLNLYATNHRYYYLQQEGVLLKDFGKYAQQVTDKIKVHAKGIAEKSNRPYLYLNSPSVSKEELAEQIMKRDQIDEGLICVLSTVELCRSFSIHRNREKKELELVLSNRKCLYFYFYYHDPELGFMHIRLQSWFPFEIQIYLNGREMLAKQLDKVGIGYERYDNCFTSIDDVKEAQRLAEKLNERRWHKLCDVFAARVNPQLGRITEIFSRGYYWCLYQCEYASDVMFKSRACLEKIMPELYEYASRCFSAEDVMTFLGRKVHGNFQGEVVSDRKRRPQGYRVRHRLKTNVIKMYDKWSVLRVETIINQPREFKVYRQAGRKGESIKAWVPMGKGIANLYRYAQVCYASNMRYLNALAHIKNPGETVAELEALCQPVFKNRRRYSGFNLLSRECCTLFSAVAHGEHCIHGFSNKDVRVFLFPDFDDNQEKQKSAHVTRLLAKLRAHRLIAKIPRSFRYKVTNKGYRVIGATLMLKKVEFPSLAMAA